MTTPISRRWLRPRPPTLPALLERVSDAFLALDNEWRVTYINETAARIFGRRREELTGKILWDEFPDGRNTPFYQAYQETVRTQTPRSFESYSQMYQCWFEVHAYPSAEGLTIFFRDVTEAHALRRRVEENEQRYRSLFEQNADAVFMFDLDGRFVEANPACETVSGFTPDELKHKTFLDLVTPDTQATALNAFLSAKQGKPHYEEIAIFHKSGRRVELNSTKIPIIVSGQVVGVYGIAKDITARLRLEEGLRESEARLRIIAEAGPVAMTITRWADGRILYANQYFRDLNSLPAEEDLSQRATPDFYADPADRRTLLRELSEKDVVQNWECLFRKADGATFWASGSFRNIVYAGEPAIFAAYHDVTRRKQLLEEARAEAESDPLTGLLNHKAFHKRLEEDAERARRTGTSLAVAVLDLDNFKFFNDAYGHGVGDEVLRQVAEVLRTICRAGDSLARFGGDEFALLMPDVGPETSAAAVAARLTSALGDISYRPPGSDSAIPIGLSVGVALFPAEAPTRLAVMQIADERLLRAKSGAANDAEAQRVRGAMRHSIQGFSMLDALVSAVDNKDRYTRKPFRGCHGLQYGPSRDAWGWTRPFSTRSPSPPCCTMSARSASRTIFSASPASSPTKNSRPSRCTPASAQ